MGPPCVNLLFVCPAASSVVKLRSDYLKTIPGFLFFVPF